MAVKTFIYCEIVLGRTLLTSFISGLVPNWVRGDCDWLDNTALSCFRRNQEVTQALDTVGSDSEMEPGFQGNQENLLQHRAQTWMVRTPRSPLHTHTHDLMFKPRTSLSNHSLNIFSPILTSWLELVNDNDFYSFVNSVASKQFSLIFLLYFVYLLWLHFLFGADQRTVCGCVTTHAQWFQEVIPVLPAKSCSFY